MKKHILMAFIALFVQEIASSQAFDTTWANRFQFVLDSVRSADNVFGVSAAMLVPGEGIWTGASGQSIPGVPLNVDMQMGIGSNTKLFTAAVMLKLQEEGLLSLDDHLYQWLPPHPNIDSNITIRQLLSHQSGLNDYVNENPQFYNLWITDTSRFWMPEEVLPYILPPNFEPGTAMSYSNTGYLLAGMIIEEASGKTWAQNLHEIIFDPLDMDSTFAGAIESPNGPIAGFQHDGNATGWFTYPITSIFSGAYAAGAIFSTAQEMAQWYHALFTGEILSESSLQQILDFEASSRFGLGMCPENDPSFRYLWYLHGGNVESYSTQIFFDVTTQAVLCLHTNQGEQFNWCYSYRMSNFSDPMMRAFYNEYPRKQHDAGITRVISPKEHYCSDTLMPQLVLKNFGTSPLTLVYVGYRIDSGTPMDQTWNGTLAPGDSTSVSLGAISLSNGFHSLTCYSYLPENEPDSHPSNDTLTVKFVNHLSPVVYFPWEEGFDGEEFPPEGWITFPDVSLIWGRTRLTSFSGTSCAVVCNSNDDYIGARFNLDLPSTDLNNIADPTLHFTYAYAYRTSCGKSYYRDSLKILISADCGYTWQTLFYKGGFGLRTAIMHQIPFFPEDNEWKEENISLAGYSGEVIIRFEDICGYGNNLYIDDVGIYEGVGVSELIATEMNCRVLPNPFHGQTTFEYGLKETTAVKLIIFNQLGQKVAILEDGVKGEGMYRVAWDTELLPEGIYYYRLIADKIEQTATGKMIKF